MAEGRRILGRLQWNRGLRAGLAVAVAMVVCRMLGRPMGWAALGGFEAILVDNGGPYRSRLVTMATVLGGGAAAALVGVWAAKSLALAVVVTALFCFAVTFARVMAQPIASTSVIILVIYFAGYGTQGHTLLSGLASATELVLGGTWAAALSLVLWPVDPFRPARLAVAGCYARMAAFTAGVERTVAQSVENEAALERARAFERTMRMEIEAARLAVGSTAARATSRTVRARNLTVLLETADVLFAATMRLMELSDAAADAETAAALEDALKWLSRAERAVSEGLAHRPADGAASFAPQGSRSMELVEGRERLLKRRRVEAGSGADGTLGRHLLADEREDLESVAIAFEAVLAVWSGSEARAWGAAAARLPEVEERSGWTRIVDPLRANWTADSVMARHAVRIAVVAAVDVVLMRWLHVGHGSWMAMTSIIVLQPYGSGTLRKSAERVGGTIGGGVVAAVLAAGVHSQTGIIAVITVTSVLTLATYAVDYGWYCFFLTPTFVLMSLPHLRDWQYAGVRIGMTTMGALVALVAMRLLWPVGEGVELGRLLGRGASAEAQYMRAMLRYWRESGAAARKLAERTVLAPARRGCGLALNDAEETLDRMMLEPALGRRRTVEGRRAGRAEALAFATYLRRLTRSVTTLAAVGGSDAAKPAKVEALAERLDAVAGALAEGRKMEAEDGTGVLRNEGVRTEERAGWDIVEGAKGNVAQEQMRRMERQVGVLERTARELLSGS